MKQVNLKTILFALLVTTGAFTTSCKSKKTSDNATTGDTTVTMTPPVQDPPPVVINEDETLTNGINDATKDYPGVTATVANGEVTLTGELQRSKLPALMASLNSLKPKKINNNLTIK